MSDLHEVQVTRLCVVFGNQGACRTDGPVTYSRNHPYSSDANSQNVNVPEMATPRISTCMISYIIMMWSNDIEIDMLVCTNVSNTGHLRLTTVSQMSTWASTSPTPGDYATCDEWDW